MELTECYSRPLLVALRSIPKPLIVRDLKVARDSAIWGAEAKSLLLVVASATTNTRNGQPVGNLKSAQLPSRTLNSSTPATLKDPQNIDLSAKRNTQQGV